VRNDFTAMLTASANRGSSDMHTRIRPLQCAGYRSGFRPRSILAPRLIDSNFDIFETLESREIRYVQRLPQEMIPYTTVQMGVRN
jgi:hypothetical protein